MDNPIHNTELKKFRTYKINWIEFLYFWKTKSYGLPIIANLGSSSVKKSHQLQLTYVLWDIHKLREGVGHPKVNDITQTYLINLSTKGVKIPLPFNFESKSVFLESLHTGSNPCINQFDHLFSNYLTTNCPNITHIEKIQKNLENIQSRSKIGKYPVRVKNPDPEFRKIFYTKIS